MEGGKREDEEVESRDEVRGFANISVQGQGGKIIRKMRRLNWTGRTDPNELDFPNMTVGLPHRSVTRVRLVPAPQSQEQRVPPHHVSRRGKYRVIHRRLLEAHWQILQVVRAPFCHRWLHVHSRAQYKGCRRRLLGVRCVPPANLLRQKPGGHQAVMVDQQQGAACTK